MTNNDKLAFAKVMALLQEIFVPGKPISKEKIQIYFEILFPYPIDDICRAAESIIKTKKISTFPLPFEFLVELGEGTREDKIELRALRAWNEACLAIHSVEEEHEEPLLNETVRVAFGGWQRFGETDPKNEAFDRKHFIECFKSLAATDFKRPEELETSILKQLAETRERMKELIPPGEGA